MKKVLIVDDEEDMVWTLKRNLKDETLAIDVVTASSGDEALAILRDTPVDLIVTDIKMPGMSGLDLLVEVKKSYPRTKMIVMTAYPSPEFKRDAAYRGSLHFIEKPFDINDLREVVRQALGEDKGFRGTVSDIELTDIIQINCISRSTVALRVKTVDREGIIFFDGGRIVHAICDGHEGEEALYEILAFEGGTLESIKIAEAPKVTIDKGFEALLMEGIRRVDEARLKRDEERKASGTTQSETAKEERMAELRDLLEVFNRLPGVNAVCLVGRDGFLLDSIAKTGFDPDMIGAIAASGFGSSESMGRELDKGALTMTMIEYEKGPVMFSPVGGEAFLVIIADKGANLGMIRLKLKNHTKDIAALAAI